MEWLLIGLVYVAALFVCYLWIDQERELRRMYRTLGTTGFRDVDDRMARMGLRRDAHLLPPWQ